MSRNGAIAFGEGAAVGIQMVFLIAALESSVTLTLAHATEVAPTNEQIPNDVPNMETDLSSDAEAGVKRVNRRPKEDFKVRLKVETNAPPKEAVSGTNVSRRIEKELEWDFNWKGWDGLQLGVSQKTHLKSPRELLGLEPITNAASIHLEQLKMSATIGGVFEVDGA